LPFNFSSLQNDRILHTKAIGIVTNKELLEYYRMILKNGYREKYFIELVDCSKVTKMCIDSEGHAKLSAMMGGIVKKLVKNIELFKDSKISVEKLFRAYPKLLVNEFCNEKFSRIMGLKKNQKQAAPPQNPEIVLALLEAYLDSFINARLAMFGTKPEVLDVFYDWQRKSRKIGYAVEVFDDIAAACSWLLDHQSN
jgi:hypothetical protein